MNKTPRQLEPGKGRRRGLWGCVRGENRHNQRSKNIAGEKFEKGPKTRLGRGLQLTFHGGCPISSHKKGQETSDGVREFVYGNFSAGKGVLVGQQLSREKNF